jgi:hypothetical protein
VSHVVLVISGMALMLLLQAGRSLVSREDRATQPKSTATSPTASTSAAPWGNIAYTPLALDRPDEYFDQEPNGNGKVAWVFRNHTEQQLNALLGSLDLPPATLAQLKDHSHWDFLPRAIRIRPPASAVVSIPAEIRTKLYHLLGENPENILQATPFRFRTNGFNDWFAECGLSKEKIELVRSMTYVDGPNLCFADAPIFAELSTPEETKALLKCVWRVSTFVMKVRIESDKDVDTITKYWGTFGAGKIYKPLLESMSRVPNGTEISVSQLFPPFARLRLYTYPDPRDTNIVRQDCFWTAMNFFNGSADNGFFDPSYTKKVLADEYLRIKDGSQQFGDLLLLLGRDNQALHMCVHVADEVVFTKNGASTQQPWVLMKISEMLGEYEKEKPFELVRYRRKTPPRLNSTVQFSSAMPSL